MRSLHQLGSRGVAITSRLRGDIVKSECWGWSGARIEIVRVRVPYPITGCEASVANLPPADFTVQLWRRQIIQIPYHLDDGTDSIRNGRGIRLPHAEPEQILHIEGSACSALSGLGTKVFVES
jgi:hypothetical protein